MKRLPYVSRKLSCPIILQSATIRLLLVPARLDRYLSTVPARPRFPPVTIPARALLSTSSSVAEHFGSKSSPFESVPCLASASRSDMFPRLHMYFTGSELEKPVGADMCLDPEPSQGAKTHLQTRIKLYM